MRGCASSRLVVGLDGRSGAGKSTIARAIAATSDLDIAVITGDDFYSGGTNEQWDRRTVDEKLASVIDWRAQRTVLSDLRESGIAEWHPFDFDHPDWADPAARTSMPLTRIRHGDLTVLEGAYSCRPELHDVLDLKVLVDVSLGERRQRLAGRDGSAYLDDWEQRWLASENHYFSEVMPPERFNLIIDARG